MSQFAYKLIDNNLGLDVPLPQQLDVDEGAMAITFPYADGNRRDGVGDLLEIGGIRLDRHRKNPVVLFDHGKNVVLPIAMAAERDGDKYNLDRYTCNLDPVNQTATVKAFFYQGGGSDYDHAVFCEQLFDMACKRMVLGGSIGYQVIRGEPLRADQATGTPQGMHLLSVLQLEVSLVVMPANMDTVRSKGYADLVRGFLSRNRCCGKALSPVLVKSLQQAVPADASKSYATNPLESRDDYANPLSDGTVPAPDWRPGQGAKRRKASKELRAKYARKSQPSDDITPEKARQILKDGEVHGHPLTDAQRRMFGAAAGKAMGSESHKERLERDRVAGKPVARTSAGYTEHGRNGTTYYDKEGYLIGFEPNTYSHEQRFGPKKKSAGSREWQSGYSAGRAGDQKPCPHQDEARRKDWLEGYAAGWQYAGWDDADRPGWFRGKGVKSLPDLRRKYARLKSIRRRLKKSAAGSSIVRLRAKDMERARRMAADKGLEFHHVGGDAGSARVKLIGSDGAIDEVAKAFGVPLGRKGLDMASKGLPSSFTLKGDQFSKTGKVAADGAAEYEEVKDGRRTGWIVWVESNGDVIDTTGNNNKIGRISKHLPTAKDKTMPRKKTAAKRLPKKVKAIEDTAALAGEDAPLEEPAGDVEAVAEAVDDASGKDLEPYGAQILRIMHENASILLQEYDEWAGPLEHEGVAAHLKFTLERVVEDLETLEDQFAEHYPDLPQLRQEEKELDEDAEADEGDETEAVEDADGDAVGADSAEEDLPTPDEALEGMEKEGKKSLKRPVAPVRPSKAIRAKYAKGSNSCDLCGGRAGSSDYSADGKWMICDGCMNKLSAKTREYIEGTDMSDRRAAEQELRSKSKSLRNAKGRKSVCPGCGKEDCDCKKGLKGKKDLTEDEAAAIEGDLDAVADEVAEETADTEKKLTPAHKKTVGEAKDFLEELGDTQDFGDEHRGKSYHYHKLLSQIPGDLGWLEEEGTEPEHAKGIKAGGRWSDGTGAENRKEENAMFARMREDGEVKKSLEGDGSAGHKDMDAGSVLSGHMKACGGAAKFLKRMSAERAFGDPHRQEALAHAKALDPILAEEDAPMEEADAEMLDETAETVPGDEFPEPGEMGEKAMVAIPGLSGRCEINVCGDGTVELHVPSMGETFVGRTSGGRVQWEGEAEENFSPQTRAYINQWLSDHGKSIKVKGTKVLDELKTKIKAQAESQAKLMSNMERLLAIKV